MPPPPPPQLTDELVEEILLRLPPASPVSLVRAGLVCKRWCHLVSDPGFQRRFRGFHRSPPVLGSVITYESFDVGTCTTSFAPEPGSGLRGAYQSGLHVQECRHGHVLCSYRIPHSVVIVVWDPITGEQVQLPKPPPTLLSHTWMLAVVCTAAPSGICDHLDCYGGPFIVVLMVQNNSKRTRISTYVYSSESGTWSEPIPSPHLGDWISWPSRSVLVGNALYFMPQRNQRTTILQYDLGTCMETAAINLPKEVQMNISMSTPIELIATKDGRLGFTSVKDTKLSVWSREVVGGGRWALCQVIDLQKQLLVGTSMPYLAGSGEGTGVIFVRVARCRLIAIDLWSGLVTEVYEPRPQSYIDIVVPYMRFFTPVLSRPPYKDE